MSNEVLHVEYINRILVFNKAGLRRFLEAEIGIDKDEDDRGLELAIFDSSLMDIEDEIIKTVSKYE